MTEYQLICRNSMVLPTTEDKVVIDTTMVLLEFEEAISSVFNIKKRDKFVPHGN